MSSRPAQPRVLGGISLVLFCYLASLVLGQSYDYGFDVDKAFNAKRQVDGEPVLTTGPPVTGKAVPVRPEFRDLQQDPDRWSLYILALDLMQYTTQDEPTSWFSITGTLHCTLGSAVSMAHPDYSSAKLTLSIGTPQVFTACLLRRGTQFIRHLAMRKLATANTRTFSSLHGTVPMSPCTR